jgi:hypothetical protein
VKYIHRLTSMIAVAAISVFSISAQAPEVKPPEKRSFKHGVKIFEDYIELANVPKSNKALQLTAR